MMGMYEKVHLSHIYKRLSHDDQYFQLGEHQYCEYEDAIVRTMNEFSERAIEMERSRYEREKKKLVESESDNDVSDDDSSNESMSELDVYNMNQEHAERNRNSNDDDNEWPLLVLNHPKEMMEDVLYMVASIPIIDLSFIRQYSKKDGVTCPCVCPFHEQFSKLKNMFIPKESYMTQQVCSGKFVHGDMNEFIQHCENQADFPHLLLMHYINEMYPRLNKKKGKKRNNSKVMTKSTKR